MRRLILFLGGPLLCLLAVWAVRADFVADGACFQCSWPSSWYCPVGQYVGATWPCSGYSQGCAPCEAANVACEGASAADTCVWDGTQAYLEVASTPTPAPGWEEITPTPAPCDEWIGQMAYGLGEGTFVKGASGTGCELALGQNVLVARPCPLSELTCASGYTADGTPCTTTYTASGRHFYHGYLSVVVESVSTAMPIPGGCMLLGEGSAAYAVE